MRPEELEVEQTMLEEALALPREQRRSFIEFKAASRPNLVRALLRSLEIAELMELRDEADTPDSDRDPEPSGSAPDPAFDPGPAVGRYRVVELLGSGATGVVYEGQHVFLNQRVALKFFPGLTHGDARALELAKQEGQTLAQLQHPAITRVLDLDEASSQFPFLVMDFVDGETLAQRLRSGPLRPKLAIRLIADIADALSASHKKAIVHRDLKPGNIMITSSSQVQVLDFGIARQLASGSSAVPGATISRTNTFGFLGTAPYASPEQWRQESVTEKSDVWSLGCVLFECVAGHCAFPRGPEGPPPDVRGELRGLRPIVRRRLIRLLGKCLREEPMRRPTAEEVRDELKDILNPAWLRRIVTAAAVCLVLWLALFAAHASAPVEGRWKGHSLVLETKIPGYSPTYRDGWPPLGLLNTYPSTSLAMVLPSWNGFFPQTLAVTGTGVNDHSVLTLLDPLARPVQRLEASRMLAQEDVIGLPLDMQWTTFDVHKRVKPTQVVATTQGISSGATVVHRLEHSSGTLVRRQSWINMGHLTNQTPFDIDSDGRPEEVHLGWNHDLSLPGDSTEGRSVMYAIDLERALSATEQIVDFADPAALASGVELGLSFPVDRFNPETDRRRALAIRWAEPNITLLVSCFGRDTGAVIEYWIRMDDGAPVACTRATCTDIYNDWILQQGTSADEIVSELDRLTGSVGILRESGWKRLPVKER